jgi:hypothetical protein
MAQEIDVKIKVDTNSAVTNVDKLGNAFENTAQEAQHAQEVFNKAGKGVEVEQSLAGLRALKRELKNTAVGTDEFKKLYNQIDDLEDKLKSAKNTSADMIDTLANAGGPIGLLGQGINSVKVATQSFGGALKATGIGLVVALVGGLVAAFSENESAMKKLEPIMEGMRKAFQGIFRAVEPIFDIFVDLASDALPYVTQGIGMVYSSLMAFFTLIKEVGTGAMQILEGIFTMDTDKISSGLDSVTGSFAKTADSYTSSMKRFADGSKELTAAEKEALEKQKEKAEKEKELREKNLKDAAEKRRKLIEEDKKALEEALSNELLTFEERRKLVADDHLISKEDRKKFNDEINKDERKANEEHKKAIDDLNKKYDDIKLNREADTAVKKEELLYNNAKKEIEALAKTETEKNELLLKLEAEHTINKAAAIEADNQAINELKQHYADEQAQKDADTEVEKEELDYKKRLAEIAKIEGHETEKAALIEKLNKDHADRLLVAGKTDAEKQIALEKAKRDAKVKFATDTTNSLMAISDALLGKSKAGMAVQKALTLTQIGIDSAAAIGKASTLANAEGVAAQLAFPLVPGIGTAARVVSYIATGAQVLSNVQRAKALLSGGGGGGGGATSAPVPAMPSAAPTATATAIETPTALTPSANVLQSSGINQLASTLGGQAPIKAYVVGKDVSTQQSLDRNIVNTATLG